MTVNTNPPCFIDPLYIPGYAPSMKEEVADGCLSLSVQLWGGKTVEVIQQDDNLEIRYRERYGIDQLFSSTIRTLETSGLFCIVGLPTMIVMGASTLVTYIAAKPFELIGKCLKESVFETDLEAKNYNILAKSHLQKLHENDLHLERLKTSSEQKNHLLYLMKLS